jgi:MSHA biogenesis protein MshN
MSLINQVLQDLEKRHASESELNSLPPYVRAVPGRSQSSVRLLGIAAMTIAAVVVLAVVVFVYGDRQSPDSNVLPRIVPKPVAMPTPATAPALMPAPAPKPPVAEPTAQAAAFNPVSRISEELGLVAPSERKERPDTVQKATKPIVAKPPRETAASASPQADKPPAPVVETPKADSPARPLAPVAERTTPPPPSSGAVVEGAPAAIDKQMREMSPSERAETAFRKGVTQIQEGRASAAEISFRDALKQDPSHTGALQALLGLLLDGGRNNDAEQVLHKALEINPRQPRHAMVLARLEVERGDVTGAINTMVGALPYVQSDSDFYAFLAALLQREGRHREAADYYRVALRGVPGNGVWMMGLGISLRASNQSAEARDAFQRAADSGQLSPELQEFVARQLRELSASKKK